MVWRERKGGGNGQGGRVGLIQGDRRRLDSDTVTLELVDSCLSP